MNTDKILAESIAKEYASKEKCTKSIKDISEIINICVYGRDREL